MHAYVFSCVWFFATLWTVTCQTLLSMKFSRQEYWSRLPFPPLGDLLFPRINPSVSCVFFITVGFFTHWTIRETPFPSLVELKFYWRKPMCILCIHLFFVDCIIISMFKVLRSEQEQGSSSLNPQDTKGS